MGDQNLYLQCKENFAPQENWVHHYDFALGNQKIQIQKILRYLGLNSLDHDHCNADAESDAES